MHRTPADARVGHEGHAEPEDQRLLATEVMRALLGTVSNGTVRAAGGPLAVVHGLERRGGTP
ncbi:MAG TPA: hypothetical protein VHN18_16780 [Micromonosporaceae bacterium]|nr:hypothetical protein [Micromonosporaceae bacterium]